MTITYCDPQSLRQLSPCNIGDNTLIGSGQIMQVRGRQDQRLHSLPLGREHSSVKPLVVETCGGVPVAGQPEREVCRLRHCNYSSLEVDVESTGVTIH